MREEDCVSIAMLLTTHTSANRICPKAEQIDGWPNPKCIVFVVGRHLSKATSVSKEMLDEFKDRSV